MKPTREGYWFYEGEPVRVLEIEREPIQILWFEVCGSECPGKVSETEDSDWGPEILPQCEHEIKMCIHPTLTEPEICRGKLCTKQEITRANPDEKSTNDGNDAAG